MLVGTVVLMIIFRLMSAKPPTSAAAAIPSAAGFHPSHYGNETVFRNLAYLVDVVGLAVDLVPPLEAGAVEVGLDRLHLVTACCRCLRLPPAQGGANIGGKRGWTLQLE